MTSMRRIRSIASVVAMLALGACGTLNNQSDTGVAVPQATNANGTYPGYGSVQSIELVKQDAGGIGGTGIGVGTIAGAVIGGVVGHQIGSGRGNTAATVIGAAGGAYAGHEIEKRNQQQRADEYRFNIRMDNGNFQTVTQPMNGEIRVGDRVQIDSSGTLRRY